MFIDRLKVHNNAKIKNTAHIPHMLVFCCFILKFINFKSIQTLSAQLTKQVLLNGDIE